MPRKPKPKAPDVCRLSVTIRGTHYTARLIRADSSDVVRAWRLRKANGTTHDFADTLDGATCDCGDFVFRHEWQDQGVARPRLDCLKSNPDRGTSTPPAMLTQRGVVSCRPLYH
jgi:hypothetical protein